MRPRPGEGDEPPAVPAQRHFTHLLASGPHRRTAWSSPSAVISIVSHAVVISALIWVNLRAPALAEATEEVVTFVDVQPEAKEEPKPEAPKPPPPTRSEAPVLPKGTQALVPPEEPPVEIPAVDLSAPAVSAEDFSGTGVIGGVADGVEGAPVPDEPAASGTEFAFDVAVLERKPELLNAAGVAALIERLYPKILKEAGIGGTVMLQFVIEPDGTIDAETVKVTESPNELLSDASTRALERVRFRPGRYQGKEVRVLIVMPISWVPPR